jgi:hypothetical protein
MELRSTAASGSAGENVRAPLGTGSRLLFMSKHSKQVRGASRVARDESSRMRARQSAFSCSDFAACGCLCVSCMRIDTLHKCGRVCSMQIGPHSCEQTNAQIVLVT